MTSGDKCKQCNSGYMGVYRTVRTGDAPVVRYLKCNGCGETGKEIVSPELSRRKITTSTEIR
jgi:hypothetical protein